MACKPTVNGRLQVDGGQCAATPVRLGCADNGLRAPDMQPDPSPSPLLHTLLPWPGLSVAQAQALSHAARRAGPAAPLAGRHVAMVSAHPEGASARVFAGAAGALGARVVQLGPADLDLADARGADAAARMLGRLYVAVGCSGLDKPSLALLERGCTAPVLHDLAATTHASRLLADVMTIQDARTASPRHRVRLGVRGRPRSRLLGAWQQLADAVGVEVVDLSTPAQAARARECDFVCLPQRPPLLLMQGRSLATLQMHNHQKVVQAWLCQALGL